MIKEQLTIKPCKPNTLCYTCMEELAVMEITSLKGIKRYRSSFCEQHGFIYIKSYLEENRG